jgi:outer membrane protein assembly factor BamB
MMSRRPIFSAMARPIMNASPSAAFRAHLLVAVSLALSLSACRKRTPVEEISASDSGIELVETASSWKAGDWPQWRGPAITGTAPDQSLPTTWSESENIKWRSKVPGRGHSSPIVVDDLVVIATAEKASQQQMVIAYDRNDGAERWRCVVHKGNFPSSAAIHPKATNANSTVASDGKRFFTAQLNGENVFVTAIDKQGNQLWQKKIGAFDSKFGYAPSPIIYHSFVIVAADNRGGGYLVALDGETGSIAWRTSRGTISSYSSPTVGKVGDRDQLLITGGKKLSSYDPTTGEEIWSTPCIAESTCGTVVHVRDRIIASGGYPDKETVCLSSTGNKIWSNRTQVYEPSLVADEEHVFAVTDDGIAICWGIETGDRLWRERLGGSFSSSPLLSAGRIYVSDLSGKTYVFEASGEAYREIAVNRLGDDCYASPAASRGELFYRIGIGSGDDRREELVCIADSGGPPESTVVDGGGQTGG